MKNKWITAAAVLTFGTTLAVALPHDGAGRGGKRGAMFSEKMAEKLNLSEAQRQQIRDLSENFRQRNQPLFDSLRSTMTQLREAREAGDTGRAQSLAATLESQRAQVKQLRDAHKQQLMSVLTAEQRAQLEAWKAQKGGRKGKRRGNIS